MTTSAGSFEISSGAITVVAALPLALRLGDRDRLRFVTYRRLAHVEVRSAKLPTPQMIVGAWLQHEALSRRDFVEISSRQLRPERLKSEARRARVDGRLLALSSTCVLASGRVAHLPLMDFRCHPSPRRLRLLEEALRQLGLPGVVLQTDNSYHFIGLKRLALSEWRAFMSRCLLFRTLVDWRYVGHCLLRQMSSVRIHGDSHGLREPVVVAHVNLR